ncbi:hypothetical protein BD779DRAFT_1678279 [Infundibulicybe gibba]|nr:hypothetical protein BD779DRAFT_1678279 [Infundibulicybe gibba]
MYTRVLGCPHLWSPATIYTLSKTENDLLELNDDDNISIRASQLVNGSMVLSIGSLQCPSSYYADIPEPILSDESVGVSANLLEEPVPPVIPEPATIAPPPPRPEVKEISIQTDEWKPPVPAPVASPVPANPPAPPQPPSATPDFGLYYLRSKTQEFKFVAPPAASTSNVTTIVPVPSPIPTPMPGVFRESSIAFDRLRNSTSDRQW